MKQVYAPGCALLIYKPEFAEKLLNYLKNEFNENIPEHLTCCRHEPNFTSNTQVINTCVRCDKRYRGISGEISTISIWEILAESSVFPFPDYKGIKMSIHDACPARSEDRIHTAIRKLLTRMNISITEPKNTRGKSVCCGDCFYDVLPVDQIKKQMKKRSDQMPCEEVVVYCVSCIKAMHIGGKKPRYIVDLLFGEDTDVGIYEPDAWHFELLKYAATH